MRASTSALIGLAAAAFLTGCGASPSGEAPHGALKPPVAVAPDSSLSDPSTTLPAGPAQPAGRSTAPIAAEGPRDDGVPLGSNSPTRPATASSLGESRVVVGQGSVPDGTQWRLTAWETRADGLCVQFDRIDPPTVAGSTESGGVTGQGCHYSPRLDQAQQLNARHRFVFGPVTPEATAVVVAMADGSKSTAWLGGPGGQSFYLAEVSTHVPIRSIHAFGPTGAEVATLERNAGEEAVVLQGLAP